ncbi:MAG TPA: amidohydrolase family protein [Vicinamibacterales bacterium]|nr:amidohydrolase family protein [Vicinamibacterales bacterium]
MRLLQTASVVLISGALGAVIAAQGMRGGTRIQPGQECPPGTTEVRPGSCMAPSEPAPSILDYRPRSTLVTAEHKVPKAKFPAIDVHGHPGNVATPEAINRVIGIMDSLNIRVMLVAENVSGQRLASTMAALNASPHKERFRVLAGVDFRNVGPGWGQKAAQQLEADLKAGAIGVGEVPKSFGLRTTKADGSRLRVDDPELDPLWQAFARLDVPAFIHTAEPQEFFQPLDYKNERWLELSLFADRRNNQPGQVTFEQLMTERNNLFRKHPKTRFVAAHFGWHANDLGRAAKMLDEFPNVTIEAGAILYDLGRQPRAAREFFTKYADRIMFGKDSFQPEEYPLYWRVFETADEYFDYYRDYHAFWKMYGMALPDDVLKKVYYKTALKVFKGLPQSGWPQ